MPSDRAQFSGANYVVTIDGNFTLIFGTSASAPTIGSMITLINDARIEAGKPPVGFINPAVGVATFLVVCELTTSTRVDLF